VEIAKALNKKVKLLILDEPTAALQRKGFSHALLDLAETSRRRALPPS
jgi:ABC-type sugar transport system ATPase subunit